MLHARISYLDDDKCKSKFNTVDLDTMVFYDSDRGSDSCQGDSGASIICSTGTADIAMGDSHWECPAMAKHVEKVESTLEMITTGLYQN